MRNCFKAKGKKAQHTIEYALLIAVVAGALLTMQAFIKRGIQGRAKDSFDQLGEEYTYNNVLNRQAKTNFNEFNEELTLDCRNSFSWADTKTGETMTTGNIGNEL